MSLILNRDFEPRHGDAVEVVPGVRRVTARNPGPFTFQGTNSFLIGEAELVILDPGPEDEAHLEALIRAIAGRRVTAILLSHGHRDHSGGAALLQSRTQAPLVAARCFPGDEPLRDGQILAAGGFALEAIATPGHTADHFAFALSGTDIVFSGDHVMGWSTTVVAPPEGSMGDYMASLQRLLGRRERVYLPAHGDIIEDAHAHMRGLRTHRRMRERAILERLAAGDRSIPELVASIYRGLDPRLISAAALSTFAHLQDLVARGLAATDGPGRLEGRYWSAGASAGEVACGDDAGDPPAAASGLGAAGGVGGTGAFGSG